MSESECQVQVRGPRVQVYILSSFRDDCLSIRRVLDKYGVEHEYKEVISLISSIMRVSHQISPECRTGITPISPEYSADVDRKVSIVSELPGDLAGG
jgi:hypothetical protein